MNTPLKVFDVFSSGPTGNAYQEMLDRLHELCGDWQDPRVFITLGYKEQRNELICAMKEAYLDANKLPFFNFVSEEHVWKRSHEELTTRVWSDGEWKDFTVPAGDRTTTVERPHSLASRVTAEEIVNVYYKGRQDADGKWLIKPKELGAIVSLYQDPANRERYLDVVAKLPIEIFFVDLFDANGERPDRMVERGASATLFRSYADLEALPELDERIVDICSDEEINAVGALPGHRKTFTLLQVAKSELTQDPLFGHFQVKSKAEKVIYLTPESSARPFYKRLKLLGLDEFIKNGTLLIRDLQMGPISLDDPALLSAVQGADVFLDTLVRFSDGDENESSDMRLLAEKLFALQKAGARSIWFSHHSVKASNGNSEMSLESAMRGSGDLGAMIANCYALRQIDRQKGTVFVQCVKRRDGQEVLPFIVEGLELRMTKKPGEAGNIGDYVGKPGPKIDPEKQEKLQLILDLTEQGKSLEEIADRAGVSVATVKRWKRDCERPPF
jgi:hypothetical protein